MPSNVLSKNFPEEIARWFQKSARDLPWRHTSDPYKIWISEMMLQQTTVATVIPYYRKFLKAFPNVRALARAHEREVLKLWEGLGYYSRARNLHRAAGLVVKEFGGQIPASREEILKLPGVGAYSAGAILSIAYRKAEAALDGNLIRVYARLLGIKKPVDDPKVLKFLWEIAGSQVPSKPSIRREFTEGMMELGATICRPRNPQCMQCPVQKMCVARRAGLAEALPRKSKLKVRKKVYEIIHLVEHKGRVAFLPTGGDPKYPHFQRLPFVLLPRKMKPRGKPMRYSVTDRDFIVDYRCEKRLPPRFLDRQIEWIDRHRIDDLLLPAIDRKILGRLKNAETLDRYSRANSRSSWDLRLRERA